MKYGIDEDAKVTLIEEHGSNGFDEYINTEDEKTRTV